MNIQRPPGPFFNRRKNRCRVFLISICDFKREIMLHAFSDFSLRTSVFYSIHFVFISHKIAIIRQNVELNLLFSHNAFDVID